MKVLLSGHHLLNGINLGIYITTGTQNANWHSICNGFETPGLEGGLHHAGVQPLTSSTMALLVG